MTSPTLFAWLARRGFYAQLHQEAAALVPVATAGQRWTDVGCGPGLMTRIAGARGYDAVGIDASPAMVKAAARISRSEGSRARFAVGTARHVPPASSAVVSAVSLLAVVADPARTLGELWSGVGPGGTLLVVEPTALMEPRHARTIVDDSFTPADRRAVAMWSAARAGRSVEPGELLGADPASRSELLSGLVAAWTFHKRAEAGSGIH